MRRAWLAQHRRLVVGMALAVWIVALVNFFAMVVAHDLDFFGPVGGVWVLSFAAFAITGGLITWHRPDHVLGPLFLGLGVIPTAANGVSAAALGPFAGHSTTLWVPLVGVAMAAGTASFVLIVIAIATFPDGRLPSDRWRWIWAWSAVTAATGAVAGFLTGAWGGEEVQTILGPPFEGLPARVGLALSPVHHVLLLGLMVASSIALVRRYRHSDATTRSQIRWLVLAVLLLVVLIAAVVVIEFVFEGVGRTTTGTAVVVTVAAGVALVPISVTIAILRHRLFDIDLVLNRAIVSGLLAVFITSLYVAIVVGVGTLLGDPSNPFLTVGAIALVAVAFQPARSRVQHWANVAVYGRRASPYEVLATITGELSSAGTADDQLGAMAALLADGMGAEHATVWMAAEGHLHGAACWPPHDPSEHPSIRIDDVGALPTDVVHHVEPVREDGSLVGALTFQRRRSDPVTPGERRLVSELAGQASLVLSSVRLQDELRRRVDELRASRERMVATQDDARRRLERDLHDGAQQQVVALKVKLGMARTIADREGAGAGVARRLDELTATVDEAVTSLRSVARGIYPPLLEAEGLERAISAHAATTSIPVSLRVEGLQRYARQVEATVYFCVVEGLRNAVQHAHASSVEVVLEDLGDRLSFSVVDDGHGFDPGAERSGFGLRNMADRIDALGGSFTVEAAPGAGVRLHGLTPAIGTAPAELGTRGAVLGAVQ